MNILLLTSIIFSFIVFSTYAIYFLIVLRSDKSEIYCTQMDNIIKTDINIDELPEVTIIIPTYNEENTIYYKIKNISEFDYPKSKIEVTIIDDKSIDNTVNSANQALEDYSLKGSVIEKTNRTGVNDSYNQTIPKAKEYIMTTDSDSIIPKETLLNSVKILMHLSDVGAVASKMRPLHTPLSEVRGITEAYNDSYNQMLISESALHSTYPGSTSCLLLRRKAFSPISDNYGSSDGNLSLSIIKNGFRFILVPQLKYYEPISNNFFELSSQKERRATRLIQSTLLHRDIFLSSKYGAFGSIIFPFKFLMFLVTPFMTVASCIGFYVFFYTYNATLFQVSSLLILTMFLLYFFTKNTLINKVLSLFIHQIYLFYGLVFSYKTRNTWKKIERTQINKYS